MRRTLLLIIVTGLVSLGAGAHAADDAKKVPKSGAVKRAIVKRDRAVEQAEAVYRKAAAEANKALLAELKKAKDAAFASKDVEEVNAVAELVKRTEKELKAGSADTTDIAGTWLVGWNNGPYPYRFSRDGSEVVNDTNKSVKSERSGTAMTYLLDNNHVHRYRRTGEYLVGEAWYSAEAFARGDRPEQVVIARRAE